MEDIKNVGVNKYDLVVSEIDGIWDWFIYDGEYQSEVDWDSGYHSFYSAKESGEIALSGICKLYD